MKNQYYKNTHDRNFENFKYVYPVISRRSGGLSLGINLNPDKICNFGCIYCQVNRNQMSKHIVNLEILEQELNIMLEMIQDNSLFLHERFQNTDESKLVFKDIAIAGDGEPSVSKYLLETLQILQKFNKLFHIPKIVIISNATGFQREKTKEAFKILALLNGEVWAKLDAGTQSYFETINQYSTSINKIIKNIQDLNPQVKLQIQTCFMKVNQVLPSTEEIHQYGLRLKEIIDVRKVDTVQIYTIARDPAEKYVDAIPLQKLKDICKPLHQIDIQIDYYSGSAN
ncbi:MAG: radical SAM protein [Candidatus Cloacimonadota bacterium]|nr:MAG: radical SAM protein [Candidatus Cloacimonadota bacterium]